LIKMNHLQTSYAHTTFPIHTGSPITVDVGTTKKAFGFFWGFFGGGGTVLVFELRTFHLLGRCSTTWATPPAEQQESSKPQYCSRLSLQRDH
jgi:hypothetical protein